ncbi:MAG: hypothetical protein KDC61_21260, partial [Saprospiraceae bacterium]|nr:hypothetical protein [Saprospiraceae bacterium]
HRYASSVSTTTRALRIMKAFLRRERMSSDRSLGQGAIHVVITEDPPIYYTHRVMYGCLSFAGVV